MCEYGFVCIHIHILYIHIYVCVCVCVFILGCDFERFLNSK